MRSLILFILAVFMTACSTTPSKNVPAIKPVTVIQKGQKVPLQQPVEGSKPLKTVAGSIFDGDLWFYQYPGYCILDWRENHPLYPGAVIKTMAKIMPEYGGALLMDVFLEGLVEVYWGKDAKMHAKFLIPSQSQLRRLRG